MAKKESKNKGKMKPRKRIGAPEPVTSATRKDGTVLVYKTPPGPKGKYQFEDLPLDLIAEWRAEGLTKGELAKKLGIDEATWYDWERRWPILREITEIQGKFAVAQVENALFKRAIGYTITERSVKRVGPSRTLAEETETEKQIIPDVKAQEVFLYNRDPERWKKKITTVISPDESVSAVAFMLKPREIEPQNAS